MSQAVLMSIHPEWVQKILSQEKRIEMRKTRPNAEPPFKVYIYQTLPKYGDWNALDGHVVCEFVCDRITKYPDFDCCLANTMETLSMLTRTEMRDYAKGKPLYGWHISDFRIYDKPKELSEFKRWNRTEDNVPCAHTKALYAPCETCTACNVTRPPQSWMYVEELE